MKSILELTNQEAKNYFLKSESYINFELPIYFNFQELLDKINVKLAGKELRDFRLSNPRDFDDVNYNLLTNKDGKFAWRPFQIIHPAIYVSLVHHITESKNWKVIKSRFKEFSMNNKIQCHSLPMISETEKGSNKEVQIYNWWKMVEQKSIALSLSYRYILQTDITDCYGSIYTHSISWAIHTKEEAKKRENRTNKSLIGVKIDNHLQDMSYGQTNGIPQGSSLMDFIAEIVLGYVDLLLSEKLKELSIKDYIILRYRDDYRVFTNNPFEGEQITKVLSEILSGLGLKLNPEKTLASGDVIKSSIKPDKRYWISNRRITENLQKWMIQLYMLSESFPNSGTLDTQMRELLSFLEKKKRDYKNIDTLISIVAEIAYRNPRVSSKSIAIISILLKNAGSDKEKLEIVEKIKIKFDQIPNSSLLNIWLQRLYMKINKKITYDELLCKKVLDDSVQIWNNKWLNNGFRKIFEEISFVDKKEVKSTRKVISKKEINKILAKAQYYN